MMTAEDSIILTFGIATGTYVGWHLYRNKLERARRIARKFREAGAISPQTAIKPEEIGISCREELLELLSKKTDDGRYYLVEKW